MPLLICSPLYRNDHLVIGRPGGVVGGRRPWHVGSARGHGHRPSDLV